jgi:Cysteine-rich secretory protein family
MLKKSLKFLILISFLLSLSSCSDDGSITLTDEEEEVLFYVNMARTTPDDYAQQFLAGGGDNGAYAELMGMTPVGTINFNVNLTRAARAHSIDMNENCGMQHDSCDGTSWSVRIKSYYDGNGIAENIAAGYGTGFDVVKAWIIDANTPSLGHRINILNGNYIDIGIGKIGSYWTQDFGTGEN